ncbi:MAG: hypothetical protein AAFU85_20910 [Planctomycetota bacterium]
MRLGLLVTIAPLVVCLAGCAEAQSTPSAGQVKPSASEAVPKRSLESYRLSSDQTVVPKGHAPSGPEPALIRQTPRVLHVVGGPATQHGARLLKPNPRVLRTASKTSLQSLPPEAIDAAHLPAIRPLINACPPIQLAGGFESPAVVARADYVGTNTIAEVQTAQHEGRSHTRVGTTPGLSPVGTTVFAPAPMTAPRKADTSGLRTEGELASTRPDRPTQVPTTMIDPMDGPSSVTVAARSVATQTLPASHRLKEKTSIQIEDRPETRSKRIRDSHLAVGATPSVLDFRHDEPSAEVSAGESVHQSEPREKDPPRPHRNKLTSIDRLPPVGDLPLQVSVDRMPLTYRGRSDVLPSVGDAPIVPNATTILQSETNSPSSPPTNHASSLPANHGEVERVGHTADPNRSTRRNHSGLRPSTDAVQLTDLRVAQLPPAPGIPTAATPPPGVVLPMPTETDPNNAQIEQKSDELVGLTATDAELRSVLRLIANHHKLSLVLGPDVTGPVTVNIRKATLEEVLDAILGVAGFHWHRSGDLLFVTGANSGSLDPRVQGRRLQVYPLDYVSASDVEPVVTSLLSPVGQAFLSQSSEEDKLKTRETIVVEDNDAGHARVSEYLAQIDLAPPQVMIEAHVLQIDLEDENRHGINLSAIARVSGADVTLSGNNFVDASTDTPGVSLRVDGTDMQSLIEAIQSQTNSRTLASPKVSVVNRQIAKVQIGQRLPFAVATTTQTATIQNVQFLDVGVVLTVTPVITEDGNILMTVLPKVSGGRITESGFPEEDTTQVETTVLMPDGGGLVIGGLIREANDDTESRLPKLGRVPVIKHLFTRRAQTMRRNELVVALVTHIVRNAEPARNHEAVELHQTLPPYAQSELGYRTELGGRFDQRAYTGDVLEHRMVVPESAPQIRIVD